ncbi:MAG: C4-type zinc ribbon domain-containing protein [Planctomycetota bacterium]
MQETLSALRGLQEIDRHIYRVQAALERLPKELADRTAAMKRMEEGIAEREKDLREHRTRVKEIEDATTGLRQRLRKLEHESNSQKVDAAMLASYQHEIRQVKRTISQAEDDGLRLVSEAETLEAAVNELRQRLTEEREVFAEFQGNVEKESAEARAELEGLQGKRSQQASGGIEPAVLDLYSKLLDTRQGEAMAELADRICQGCFVEIPRNLAIRLARSTELVQCPNCQRILFSY